VNPFRGRSLLIVIAATAGSFLALLLWTVFGSEILPPTSANPDSFSRSAVGHHAFVELLKELHQPVVVSRFNSGAKARSSALLVVAEPDIGWDDQRRKLLQRMISRAERTLLVLPKWECVPSKEDPEFIQSAHLIEPEEIRRLLTALGSDVDVFRLPAGTPVAWASREIGAVPRLNEPQLLARGDVRPYVSCAQGVLLGRIETSEGNVVVLSDPDLISNHGILVPENAEAVMGILDLLRGGMDVVVFDETLHGFEAEPSFYRSLFRLPLGLATLQALFTVVVLLWAAMGRFGAPQRAEPPLEAGKKALIGNIASLLALGGHGAAALGRYLDGAVAEVRAALHVPAATKGEDLEEQLARAEGKVHLRDLRVLVENEKGDRRRVLAIALRIHRWREEMIRGRVGHP
jgi:hypothetical protein